MAVKNNNNKVWYSLAATRVLLGVIFLWAFFDKLFGLGFSTPASKAWVSGGSPTTGFLKGVDGPCAQIFNSMAGAGWADWLFMAGLLGIGFALVFGLAVRLATATGALLLVMMWAASLPIKTNPVFDEHIVYITVLAAIAFQPEQKWSLNSFWRGLPFVKQNRWLW